MKMLGVLGGMGPQASIHFYNLCIKLSKERFNAKKNSDYPHILLSNLPVPDFIKDRREEELAVRQVEDETVRLVSAGAKIIALTCNTMHLHEKRFASKSGGAFRSMVDAVVRRIQQDGIRKVGLLGSVTTMQSDLYVAPLAKVGIGVIVPSIDEQEVVGSVILKVIADNVSQKDIQKMSQIVQKLCGHGAEGIILGCTELPLIAPSLEIPRTKIYNSLQILAEKVCEEVYAVH